MGYVVAGTGHRAAEVGKQASRWPIGAGCLTSVKFLVGEKIASRQGVLVGVFPQPLLPNKGPISPERKKAPHFRRPNRRHPRGDPSASTGETTRRNPLADDPRNVISGGEALDRTVGDVTLVASAN
jgi:hypothetical protein